MGLAVVLRESYNAKFGWVIPSRPEMGISCFRKCILMYLQ